MKYNRYESFRVFKTKSLIKGRCDIISRAKMMLTGKLKDDTAVLTIKVFNYDSDSI